MNTNTSIRELAEGEQIRMTIKDAGKLYNGYFIFFTNSEEIRGDRVIEEYGVPRVIASSKNAFYHSGLFDKYRNHDKYGVTYACFAFMNEDNLPPLLTF